MTMDGKQPHVLVVDDSPAILSLIRDLLEEELLQVTTRSDADLDLDDVVGIAPDLIVLDPAWGPGEGLLHELTGDARAIQIPIILCTGAVREKVDAVRESLGAVDLTVVRKPFDIDHLMRVVRAELGLTSEPEAFPPSSGSDQ
jgi:DNA-binding response OmpR family regulator